jgi:hypothetical protein
MSSIGVVRDYTLHRSGPQVAATYDNAPRVVGVLGTGYHSCSVLVCMVCMVWFSVFYVYFAHIGLIEYDYWEQFESIQRLPQRRPLIHVKGVRA